MPSDKNDCKQGGIGDLLIDLRSTTRKMVWEWEVSTLENEIWIVLDGVHCGHGQGLDDGTFCKTWTGDTPPNRKGTEIEFQTPSERQPRICKPFARIMKLSKNMFILCHAYWWILADLSTMHDVPIFLVWAFSCACMEMKIIVLPFNLLLMDS